MVDDFCCLLIMFANGSIPTKRLGLRFGSKLLDILKVFIKDLFEKIILTTKKYEAKSLELIQPGLYLRVCTKNYFFLFLKQNICCGYSKELSQ